jgi:hypothetical protein
VGSYREGCHYYFTTILSCCLAIDCNVVLAQAPYCESQNMLSQSDALKNASE